MGNFPEFGRRRLVDFNLDKGLLHLNHGGYGATPRVVLKAAEAARSAMEGDPTGFFRYELLGSLRNAAFRVAQFLGGNCEDWAFVENATGGLNAVIASMRLAPGDELICLSQVYGAVANTLRYHAERSRARIVVLPVPVPFDDAAPLLAALEAAIGPKTRLACFDHITSGGAVVMPIAGLAEICRRHGVPVAVDGAHAPGQVAFDVPALGVDWYVGNLHKWAFAAKGTGVIWCSPEYQGELHPIAISHYLGQGFAAEFDYSGTRDNSNWLAVPAALDYFDRIGREAIYAHNTGLAEAAGALLATAWGTERAAGPGFRASMVSVRLPGLGGDRETVLRVAKRLRQQHGIIAGVMSLDGGLWIRVSAQIHNEIGDYQRLAEIGKSLAA
ncbi:MAG: aminotransferase class V-fold PLP-dependent enzyme [Alphaproteobacteria bacterium]|nr:aminotransferase class V-fold PLP-dependent enzyme [Alphaproteobacteria bacterium]